MDRAHNSFIQVFALLVASWALLSGCQTRPENSVNAAPVVISSQTVLATLPSLASTVAAESLIAFDPYGRSVLCRFGADNAQQVVFNNRLIDNQFSSISHVSLSPDGKRYAHDMLKYGKRAMIVDGVVGQMFDDVYKAYFSPDNKHYVYTAQLGSKDVIVVDNRMSEPASREFSEEPTFSHDSKRIAFIEKSNPHPTNRLNICDLYFKNRVSYECRDENLTVNSQHTRLAAIKVSRNQQAVYSLAFDAPNAVDTEQAYDKVDHVAFSQDGISLVYVAQKNGKWYLVANKREVLLPSADGFSEPPAVSTDGKRIGVLYKHANSYYLYQAGAQNAKGPGYSDAGMLVFGADNTSYAYCARMKGEMFVVINGHEGPQYDFVVSPKFTPDGRYVVYRARKGKERFVVVMDLQGKVVKRHASYEQVLDTVFTADGMSVAYGVKDGLKLIWKVEKL